MKAGTQVFEQIKQLLNIELLIQSSLLLFLKLGLSITTASFELTQ